jgi:hypothetical protein
MPNENDVYRRLQEHLDNMPVGFPATESGIELRILRRLFTPDEAEIALLLSAVPEPLHRIHRRATKAGPTRGGGAGAPATASSRRGPYSGAGAGTTNATARPSWPWACTSSRWTA